MKSSDKLKVIYKSDQSPEEPAIGHNEQLIASLLQTLNEVDTTIENYFANNKSI